MNRDVLLLCIYVPPKHSPYYETVDSSSGVDDVEKCINDMLDLHGDCAIMLCGDFNARTGCSNTVYGNDVSDMSWDVTEASRYSDDRITNEFGNSLLTLCIAFELVILNGCVDAKQSEKFTFVSHAGSSVIDYWIVSPDIMPFCSSFFVNESVVSPHMCLELSLSCRERKLRRESNVIVSSKIIWDSGSRDEYLSRLRENLLLIDFDSFLNEDDLDVDNCTEVITSCLTRAADFLVKTIVKREGGYERTWYDSECSSAKKQTNKLLKRFMRTHSNDDRAVYVKTRNDYKQLIRNKKRDYRQAKTKAIVDNLSNGQLFWKQIRALNFKTRVSPNIDLDAWVQYFKQIYSNECYTSEDVLYTEEDPTGDFSAMDSEISLDEILSSIKSLKVGKAPGDDKVLGEMLKCSANVILPYLGKLFNAILQKTQFPSIWTRSIIVPLHKGGSYDTPDNYRGISLTSTLSKVFLHIITQRLQAWADDNDLIGEEQAGFRKGYSTIDNIFILQGFIQKYLSRQRKLYVMFVDFKKAFDTVSRSTLEGTLKTSNIGGKIGKLIRSMYESVRCCIRCPNGNSEYFECTSGLKQGCKTSPIIFSMLMSILSKTIIRNGKHGLQILPNDAELFTLLFADDLVLLSDTVIGLQNQINNMRKASESLGLAVNTNKTKVVVFRCGGYLAAHERWFLGDEQLEVVTQYKYLGVMLSTKLCTNTMLSELVQRAKVACIQIIKSLKKLSFVPPNVLFKIFDAQIQPILLYGAEIWGLDCCRLIEHVHMYMLKWYMNVATRTPNTMVYGDTGRYPLRINAALRSVKYWLRLLRMDNERYPRKIYQMMFNSSGEQCNWVSRVKTLLLQYSFDHEWSNQNVENENTFINSLKERMVFQFEEEWKSEVQNKDRFSLYRQIKQVCTVEPYLYALDKKPYRDAWIRFRLGISDLYVHRNRYNCNPHSTVCPLCMEEDEDENHFLFYCPALFDLRKRYILPHVREQTNDLFQGLFSTMDASVIRNVSNYLYQSFKRRSLAVETLDMEIMSQ